VVPHVHRADFEGIPSAEVVVLIFVLIMLAKLADVVLVHLFQLFLLRDNVLASYWDDLSCVIFVFNNLMSSSSSTFLNCILAFATIVVRLQSMVNVLEVLFTRLKIQQQFFS